MALFLSFLAKVALAYLSTTLFVALRPLFPFRHAQYVQVFPLKFAPFCTLFAGLGSTNKSAISLLLPDSRSVFAILSSPASFLLPQSPRKNWQELSSLLPVLSGYNRSLDTPLSSISIKELVLSRLRSSRHSLLLSSYFFRIGRIKNRSCSACGHSPQDTFHLILHCPATGSLHRSIFGDSLSLYNLWLRPWRVSRLLGLHDFPPCPHPLEGLE